MEETIATLSFAMPPIDKTNISYIIMRLEVKSILFLSNCGLPIPRKTVFTARAIIINSDTGPCHDKIPTIIIEIVSKTIAR